MKKEYLLKVLESEGAQVEHGVGIEGRVKCTMPSGVVIDIDDSTCFISNPALCFPLSDAYICDEPQYLGEDSVISHYL